MISELYDYHRWANRRLFDVATALSEPAAGREVGAQFSFPTVTRLFGHLYGADWVWLERWKGRSPTRLPGAEFPALAALQAIPGEYYEAAAIDRTSRWQSLRQVTLVDR